MHYFLDIAGNRGVDNIENQIFTQQIFTGVPFGINNGWYLFLWYNVYRMNDVILLAHIVDRNMSEFVRMN